jgi:hypothetical protein
VSDKALKKHLKRMKTDPEYVGKRHPDDTSDRWSFDGLVEACEQIIAFTTGKPSALTELYTLILPYAERRKEIKVVQLREDVRAIWERGRGSR